MGSNSVSIIFDTDMDVDCDDTGALAILHAFMNDGKADILGIICDVPSIDSARVAKAINTYYNRSDIPIGIVKAKDFETSQKYEMYREIRNIGMTVKGYYPPIIAREFDDIDFNEDYIFESIKLYRKLLSEAEDHSVVIIAVGLLTALAELLDSGSDEISPLSGSMLIERKVKKLISMGMGAFPSSRAEFNWLLDWESACNVINNWPSKLIVTTLGSKFQNGKTLSTKTPKTNPVRRCYEIYMEGENRGNYSWDLVATYHGVRNENPYFEEVNGFKIVLERGTGNNHWEKDLNAEKNHSFLKMKSSLIQAKKELERLLTEAPKK